MALFVRAAHDLSFFNLCLALSGPLLPRFTSEHATMFVSSKYQLSTDSLLIRWQSVSQFCYLELQRSELVMVTIAMLQ